MYGEPCTCGCEHCPTVVWDIEDQFEHQNGEFASWLAANGIDPRGCADVPVKIVRLPHGTLEILWLEVVPGPFETPDPGTSEAWPKGLAHEWGKPDKVKCRRSTLMIVSPPGCEFLTLDREQATA